MSSLRVSMGALVAMSVGALAACSAASSDAPRPSPTAHPLVPAIVAPDDAGFPARAGDAPSIRMSLVTGNPDGTAAIPAEAAEEDVSQPDHVVGAGTPESCTAGALADAMRGGGVITFDCGFDPVTIALDRTLTTCNTHNCAHPWQGGIPVARMVLDGGGRITLSGNDQRGIFYANSCEETFGWLSADCTTATTPLIVFQNITLEHGNATSGPSGLEGVGGGGGGGAIAMRGGQFKAVNVLFRDNVCVARASDAGGGAVRLTLSQGGAFIVNSTFENNKCANGGAISGLHASITVLNSLFTGNSATGTGASSGQGGNGGALYGDGNAFDFVVEGSAMSGNYADEGGPAIFFVSNDRSGTLTLRDSILSGNTGENFHTSPYRDIFYLGGGLSVTGSTVE